VPTFLCSEARVVGGQLHRRSGRASFRAPAAHVAFTLETRRLEAGNSLYLLAAATLAATSCPIRTPETRAQSHWVSPTLPSGSGAVGNAGPRALVTRPVACNALRWYDGERRIPRR